MLSLLNTDAKLKLPPCWVVMKPSRYDPAHKFASLYPLKLDTCDAIIYRWVTKVRL